MAVQPLMPPLASGSAGLQISTFVPEHTAERMESWCTPTRGEPVHERGRRLGEPVTTGTPTTSLPSCLLPRDGRVRRRRWCQSASAIARWCGTLWPRPDGSARSAGAFLIVEERDYIGHELG